MSGPAAETHPTAPPVADGTLDAAARRELREALGASAVAEHEPVAADGVPVATTLAPADPDALAAALAIATRRGLALVVRGGGTRLGLGNRPRAAAAWLSTAALASACEVDADEGVVRVSASTPVARLDAAAREAGWRAPLEISRPGATLGGALACAAEGPRALGLGPPRRAALGLDVVLATGERTRCGSRVVKNVSGYDLVKLHVGALGTLGVLTAAWLRLRPAPEVERVLSVRAGADGLALARAAARRPGVQAAAWVDGRLGVASGPDAALVVALAGDAPVVEDAEAWLREQGEVHASDPAETASDAVDRLRAVETDPETAPLRLRISAPASALAGVHARLADAGARVVVHPGLRRAFAFLDLAREDVALVDAAWRAAREAADAAAGAHVVLEQAPSWAKAGRDVFDLPPATLPLMRALKARFDPAGVLNPGRFAGGL